MQSGHAQDTQTAKGSPQTCYLAGQNVAKSREGVVQGLIINRLVQVLNENVTNTTFPQRWVTLGPHDAHRPAFDHVEVHCVQSTLSWRGGEGRIKYNLLLIHCESLYTDLEVCS